MKRTEYGYNSNTEELLDKRLEPWAKETHKYLDNKEQIIKQAKKASKRIGGKAYGIHKI